MHYVQRGLCRVCYRRLVMYPKHIERERERSRRDRRVFRANMTEEQRARQIRYNAEWRARKKAARPRHFTPPED